MANEQNLKPGGQPGGYKLSREEAKKGGIRSAETRRRRKTLREELLLLLGSDDVQKKISTALINEAMNGNNAGSVTRAFEVVRDTIGEKPVEKVMLSEVDQSVINEVEKAVLDDDEIAGD